MIKKILTTMATRYFIAALNLLLIFINAKVLGVHGVGLVGVIYASANIAVIVGSVLCGNTIVYFMNRYPLRLVIIPAYLWAFVGSAIACAVMALCGVLPEGYAAEVFALALVLSLVAVHSRVLLGKDHIKSFNITYMIQGGALFFILLYIYYVVGKKDAEGYLWGLYLTNGIACVVSLFLIAPFFFRRKKDGEEKTEKLPMGKLLREMFVYGLWSSADNLAEGLTTRLNYFLLQRLGGYGQVGLLDAGTRISESVWHISRSISSISYSQIAKTSDPETQRRMTLRFFKGAYCAMILVVGLIWMIPEWVYTEYLFTAEFQGVRKVIRALSAGIVALGGNSILSHYFIGTGRVRYSAVCSCAGLLVLLFSGYFLIPAYGVFGSAASTSIAFSAMLAFSLTVFVKQTHTPLRQLLPTRADFRIGRGKRDVR